METIKRTHTNAEADSISFEEDAVHEAFRDLSKVWGDPANPDPLHPDLADYVGESEGWGTTLRHPLVYSVPHHDLLNRQVNFMFEHKRTALKAALAKGEFGTYVWLHERPWRLDAFSEIATRLSDQRYWELLGQIWTDSENIYQNGQLWRSAFESMRGCRWAVMTAEDRKMARKLRRRKVPILVYRGYAYDEGDQGMSWTLDKRRAEWFARRFAGLERREHPMCATGLIDGYNIIAYFGSRNEEEIVVFPEDVTVLKFEEVDR